MRAKELELEKAHKAQMDDKNKEHQATLETFRNDHKAEVEGLGATWSSYVQSEKCRRELDFQNFLELENRKRLQAEHEADRTGRLSRQKWELESKYKRRKEVAELQEDLAKKRSSMEFWEKSAQEWKNTKMKDAQD